MDDINITCRYDEDINDNIAKAEQILAKGNFTFKNWIKSGDKTENKSGLFKATLVFSVFKFGQIPSSG